MGRRDGRVDYRYIFFCVFVWVCFRFFLGIVFCIFELYLYLCWLNKWKVDDFLVDVVGRRRRMLGRSLVFRLKGGWIEEKYDFVLNFVGEVGV